MKPGTNVMQLKISLPYTSFPVTSNINMSWAKVTVALLDKSPNILYGTTSSKNIRVKLLLRRCRISDFHSGGYEEYHLLGYDAV
jgi:hypothetical protein